MEKYAHLSPRGGLSDRWFDGSEPRLQASFAGIARSSRSIRACFECQPRTWCSKTFAASGAPERNIFTSVIRIL